MRAQCVNAVTQAVGRKLNNQELTDIQGRIERHMTMLARQNNPQWRSLSKDQQITAAAQTAAQEIVAEAARRKANIARQAVATARNKAQWDDLVHEGRSGASAAARVFELVDRDVRGVRQQYFGELLPVLNYLRDSSKWLGWAHDSKMMKDLVHEIFGRSSGNTQAKAAAKSWLDTIEVMRQRFNNAGGDVGKLDYGYLPQPHDARRVFKVGKDAWVQHVLPKLDRSRYITPEGRYFSDAELKTFLESAYETISTGGLNKMEPGKISGSSKLANRHGDARQIHFKDADSYLQYMTEFGKGNPIAAMQGHISGLARDIALVEGMGPNPNQTAKLILDNAEKNDGGVKHVGPVTAEQMWNVVTGAYTHPVSVKLAEIAQGVRNVTTAVKLQGAFLSAFTDIGTLALNAKYNRLPVWRALRELPKAFGGEYKEYAGRVSLMADSVISDMNRWADGHGGVGWTSKLADTTMRATLLTGWTDALKRSFSVNMMGALGKLSRTNWGSLPDADRVRLERAGIDQATWDIWQSATPENWRGNQMLTPEAIKAIPGANAAAKDKAIAKLLGYILDEADTAITSPDLMGRTVGAFGSQKGTVPGEIWRSLWLFKTFSVSILSRQSRRIKDINASMGSGYAMAYGASLMASLTVLGGLSLQAKDMVTGKDPRNMNPFEGENGGKFWLAAFMQGGGMGIFGDILYTAMGGNSRGGQPNWTGLLGPVFGTLADFGNLTFGNIGQAAAGKDTNLSSELIRFARQNTPFLNLWYAKTAINHMVFHNFLEMANPGYLRRLRERTRKEWGQDYWWRPGDGLPSRAPDAEAVTGG